MLKWRLHSDYYSLGPGGGGLCYSSISDSALQPQGLRPDPWPMNHDPTSSGISGGIQRKKKGDFKKRDEKQAKIARTKNKK